MSFRERIRSVVDDHARPRRCLSLRAVVSIAFMGSYVGRPVAAEQIDRSAPQVEQIVDAMRQVDRRDTPRTIELCLPEPDGRKQRQRDSELTQRILRELRALGARLEAQSPHFTAHECREAVRRGITSRVVGGLPRDTAVLVVDLESDGVRARAHVRLLGRPPQRNSGSVTTAWGPQQEIARAIDDALVEVLPHLEVAAMVERLGGRIVAVSRALDLMTEFLVAETSVSDDDRMTLRDAKDALTGLEDSVSKVADETDRMVQRDALYQVQQRLARAENATGAVFTRQILPRYHEAMGAGR